MEDAELALWRFLSINVVIVITTIMAAIGAKTNCVAKFGVDEGSVEGVGWSEGEGDEDEFDGDGLGDIGYGGLNKPG